MHIGERLERGLEALKDIQWEIRENEARYRDLLDNQADVILRRDAEGRLTFVNQAFCRTFELERRTSGGFPRCCWDTMVDAFGGVSKRFSMTVCLHARHRRQR